MLQLVDLLPEASDLVSHLADDALLVPTLVLILLHSVLDLPLPFLSMLLSRVLFLAMAARRNPSLLCMSQT